MNLSEVRTGDKAVIVKISGYGGFRKRIIEMGFVKGKVVEVLRNAPLQDPIEYAIMDSKVLLRRNEAQNIEVISITEAEEIAKQSNNSEFNGTITENDIRKVALEQRKVINVALVGNPNCGKTSLFNAAANEREHVGNYSGVTVDAKKAHFNHKGYKINLVDLPGTYSLAAYSPEEKYVRNHIANQKPDVIINVLDASNLERNLFLTTQLIDMNMRMVLALNMYDELEKRGDKFDHESFGRLLGMPVVPTITIQNKGITKLFDTVVGIYEGSDILDEHGKLIPTVQDDELIDKYLHEIGLSHKHADEKNRNTQASAYYVSRHIHINYGNILEKEISGIKKIIDQHEAHKIDYTPRYFAIKMLERDIEIEAIAAKLEHYTELDNVRNASETRIKELLHDMPENLIMDAQFGFIMGALKETYTANTKQTKHTKTEKIDRIVTNKYFGYPIFILAIYLMFQATFTLGEYPMEWIENGIGWISNAVSGWLPAGMLRDLIVDGMIGGVGGVLVFLPNILILYFFISLFESSGYMTRAVFIMDKIMHKIGLHGRSFIPLIMGFGCNVPAIMATRTIENRNNRMVTILINPLISCGARLPVYLLLAGTFFPKHGGLVLFAIYFTGIVLAGLLAIVFKKFLFTKEETPFVMELPPYRIPSIKIMLRDTWDKGAQYLRKIGTVILFASVLIWALSYFPQTNHSTEQLTTEQRAEQQENSYLGRIGKFIQPALAPLGFDWKTSVALLTGFSAKEVVVSTLGVLYNIEDVEAEDSALPERLMAEKYADGTPVFTPAVALSLMLFVLIYFPCIATIITIKNETQSWGWAIFVMAYTVTLAWLISVGVYQSVVHQAWQEILVGSIILLTAIGAALRIKKTIKARHTNKCTGCSGNCDAC